MIYLILSVFIISLLIFYSKGNRKVEIRSDVSTNADLALLNTEVEFYQALSDDAKQRFEKRVGEFLDHVTIEGVGTEISDKDRILIASSAVIPVFGFEGWRYKNLTNVILYPDNFDHEFQFEGDSRNIMGMVGTGYMNGQMILSRPSLYKGFSSVGGKENVGIHEFVHLLDKSDGNTDGIPETFISPDFAIPWLKMMHQEMNRIERGKSDINPYASTNEAEFLAVASEYFFSKPEKFQDKHPELYDEMAKIFYVNTGKE